ncbi:MAG: glucose-6-phosphate dehydrogenase [Patescibacteria group bacterium]
MSSFQTAEKDFTLIVFGASGSLAKLKIFPSIYQLFLEKRLPVNYKVVGYARSAMTNEQFREDFREAVVKKYKDVDQKILNQVLENVSYVQGQYDQKGDFENLKKELEKEEKTEHVRIAYLAIPPSVFDAVIENIALVNFNTESSTLRLILEKPLGYNLESAKLLKKKLFKFFEKEQIYLLDHYLGKEAVFNVLSLRYANAILARLIQGKYIKNIQISGLESVGVEGRANYFDHVGTLRDMIQSHMFQILAFLTMNLPEEIDEFTIHREKENLLRSIKIKDLESSVIRGQYAGYTSEEGVQKNSRTETFAALKVFIDHQDWHGIPIYLRSGKKLKKQWSAIVIEFKHLPLQRNQEKLSTNKLVIQLQPGEKIEFQLLTKKGGAELDFHELVTGRAIYCSGDCLEEHGKLLLECIKGNRLLFLGFEEVEASWKVIDPVLDHFEKSEKEAHKYEPGTSGPKEADDWIAKDGFQWFNFYE